MIFPLPVGWHLQVGIHCPGCGEHMFFSLTEAASLAPELRYMECGTDWCHNFEIKYVIRMNNYTCEIAEVVK